MAIIKIEKWEITCGIEYHGKVYEVDPLVEAMEKAQERFKNVKNISVIREAILMVVPDFPVGELRMSEVMPVINGITKAIRESVKKD